MPGSSLILASLIARRDAERPRSSDDTTRAEAPLDEAPMGADATHPQATDERDT
jgi:hypothetical protein